MTSITHVASITKLRTEVNDLDLSNPNPLGAANELVDRVVLEAPDGTQIKVRTLYDTGAQDSIIDWKLARFYHHAQEAKVETKGINSTKGYSTHVIELKVVRVDGTPVCIKALKGDMSSPAFTLKKKFINIPPQKSHYIAGSELLPTNSIGDKRITQPAEDYQVQLLLGLDNVAYMPMELDRHADEGGQLILYRSCFSGLVLPSGSRRTGHESSLRYESGQRIYKVI